VPLSTLPRVRPCFHSARSDSHSRARPLLPPSLLLPLQNGVESVANFYATLLISALTTPALSAAAGLVYLVGRIVYAQGYYVATENRARGGFYLLGQMYLVGGALYTAFTMLRSA
jgi:hypothetical protein